MVIMPIKIYTELNTKLSVRLTSTIRYFSIFQELGIFKTKCQVESSSFIALALYKRSVGIAKKVFFFTPHA